MLLHSTDSVNKDGFGGLPSKYTDEYAFPLAPDKSKSNKDRLWMSLHSLPDSINTRFTGFKR